jgi:hypothetical protein
MYNLDEKQLDHVIEIHESMRADMSFSDDQVKNNVIQCRGDLYTIEQNRYSAEREG